MISLACTLILLRRPPSPSAAAHAADSASQLTPNTPPAQKAVRDHVDLLSSEEVRARARVPGLRPTPPLPVVIVGAGPVGMGVALGLAQRGIAVTILEAADQVSFGSRAICVSRHSLEVADRLGFGDELEDIVLPWVGGRSYYRDQEVLHFRMAYEDHDVRAPMVNVSQSEFEQIMTDTLAPPAGQLPLGVAVAGVAAGRRR